MLILLIKTEHEAPTDSQTKKCPQSKPDRTRRKQPEKTIYIVIFLDFHSTAIGWFLVTWLWLKSNVSRSWYVKHPAQDTLQHVIKAWCKVAC